MVEWLAPAPGVYDDPELAGPAHPNRPLLRQVVRQPERSEGWRALRDDYTAQARGWAAWVATKPDYFAPLAAGLAHLAASGRRPGGLALEVGAGTGRPESDLPGRVLTTDVVPAMLRGNPAPLRAVCDVRALPLRDGAVDLVFGLNAVPHFAEFDRVLGERGAVLLATSFREHTPLHLGPEEIERALGPGWRVRAQAVAAGDWVLAVRVRDEESERAWTS